MAEKTPAGSNTPVHRDVVSYFDDTVLRQSDDYDGSAEPALPRDSVVADAVAAERESRAVRAGQEQATRDPNGAPSSWTLRFR